MNEKDLLQYGLTGWKQNKTNEFDVNLPSGQTCRVKKLTMEKIVELGLMNDLDSFTGSIMPKDKTSKKKSAKQEEKDAEAAFMDSLKDRDKFGTMMNTVHKVVVSCVIIPQVSPAPAPGEPRDPERVYVDEDIDFNDKLALFGKIFDGLGGMESFREGSEPDVGAVAEVTGPSLQAE